MPSRKSSKGGHFSVVGTTTGLCILAVVLWATGLYTDVAVSNMPSYYPLLFGGAVSLGLLGRILLIRAMQWHHNDLIFGFVMLLVASLFPLPNVAFSSLFSGQSVTVFYVTTTFSAFAVSFFAMILTLWVGLRVSKF